MDHDEMRKAMKRATEEIPTHGDGRFVLWQADCREALARLDDNSVDAIVTDPPYGLEFMGKEWDAPWKQSGTVLRDPAEVGGFQDGAGGNPFSRSRIRYGREGDAMVQFQQWFTEIAAEALRILKPGGHLLAFGGSRTYHRLACAVEDAGFEIRDQIMWVYGSGFPKSLDVSKAIDKRGGVHAEFAQFRDAVKDAMKRNGISRAQLQDALGNFMLSHYLTVGSQPAVPNLRDYRIIRDTVGLGDEWNHLFDDEAEREVVGTAKTTTLAVAPGQGIERPQTELDITAPATDAAKQWNGWGTALKPSHEPIVVARKPLEGTVAANVLKWGTGALNIDGTRVGTEDALPASGGNHVTDNQVYGKGLGVSSGRSAELAGRWPANFIHDGSDEVMALFPNTKAGVAVRRNVAGKDTSGFIGRHPDSDDLGYGDSGSAARFFYCAKASKAERNAGLGHLPEQQGGSYEGRVDGSLGQSTKPAANHHPTVKPIALMRYLIRLVTPPGGVVLDPFAGSGTTMVAALMEGVTPWGCEMTEDYIPIILGRIQWALDEVDSRIAGTL